MKAPHSLQIKVPYQELNNTNFDHGTNIDHSSPNTKGRHLSFRTFTKVGNPKFGSFLSTFSSTSMCVSPSKNKKNKISNLTLHKIDYLTTCKKKLLYDSFVSKHDSIANYGNPYPLLMKIIIQLLWRWNLHNFTNMLVCTIIVACQLFKKKLSFTKSIRNDLLC